MANNIQIVGQVVNTDIVNRYDLQDEKLLLPTIQQETFGQENDYIEYFIFDLGGNTLNSNYDYRSYKLPLQSAYSQSLLPDLEIDPVQDITDLGYESGEVTSRYNFFRKIQGEPFDDSLFIQQISSDRTEIRVSSTTLSSDELLSITTDFLTKQESVPYYYYVLLNFGNNNQVIAVNMLSDVTETGNVSILFKLADPLPSNIGLKNTFWIVEEIVNPYIYNVSLDKIITPPSQPSLKGPNFNIDLQFKEVIPTSYNSYTQLISYLTGSSYQAVLNSLANQQTNININYSVLNDFIHYSSAENRLSNFIFKIGELESYQSEIDVNTPLTSSNPSLVGSVNRASSSINDIIASFDGFESYLYFTSSSLESEVVIYNLETGSYFQYNIAPYPKSNSTQPYILYPSSSTEVQNWYNQAIDVALTFDANNNDILFNTIPLYIKDDPDNYYPYIVFINMIGQYFDNIWIYVNKLTDVWDNNNNINKGISQDLIYDWLESFGIKLYNYQGSQDVLDYTVGGYSGSVDFNNDYSPSSSFLNNVPKKELVIDTYKRIYHNLPYLFKTKGAYGGLQGLITSFGITGSILPIKEYGGTTDYQDLKGYNDDKITLSDSNITGSILSSIKRLETSPTSSRNIKSQDLHFIDVSFSPQTQIDNAVSASITSVNSSWVLDDYIGDPRDLSLNTYPSLSFQRDYWFGQTFDTSFDYGGFIRLIQFFDNSLFKMVKDFSPARGNTWTGVSIKSPVLERPKFSQYNPRFTQTKELSGTTESSSLTPIYDPYYYYIDGDKAPYYDGNIEGSNIDTYTIFEENNKNPYLVNNTVGYTPPGFISGSTDFILTTNNSDYNDFFINSDFNVLQNNVSTSLVSVKRQKVTPIYSIDKNGNSFTSYSITEPVQLQDSYLSLGSYTNSRYNGVQLFSRFFNTWSFGDTSYGKSAVIDLNVKKLGLFVEVEDNNYLPYKSNVVLKYLVDETGKLTELNKRNRNWEEVQNTFRTGDTLAISQFDPKKYSNQTQTDGNRSIHESGYSYFPIYYAFGASGSNTETTAAAFIAPDGNTGNVADRFFELYTVTGSLIKGGTNPISSFVSSSANSVYSTGNFSEMWNFLNLTGSFSLNGTYFHIGTGPGSSPSNIGVTSSYYTIPDRGAYQFIYDFTLNTNVETPPLTEKILHASMEIWKSSSIDGTFTLYDKNPITSSFRGQTYRGDLGSFPFGYYSVSAFSEGDSFTTLNGYFIYEYDNIYDNTPSNIIEVNGDTVYKLYHFYGFEKNPNFDASVSDQLGSDVSPDQEFIGKTIRTDLGLFWIKESDISRIGTPSQNDIKLYVNLSLISSNTNASQDLTFRRTVSIPTGNSSPGDKFVFRLFVDNDNNNTLINYVSMSNQGTFKVKAPEGQILAQPSQVCFNDSANSVVLNSTLTPFFGPAYFFDPLNPQVSASYADLYNQYGDIQYPFILSANDKIVIQAYSHTGALVEYTVDRVDFYGAPGNTNAYIKIREDVDGYFNQCNKFHKILFLKRIIDETNIILDYVKPTGKTSYGFSIPYNISPVVMNNIDNINKNVNQQLIDVGINTK